MSSYGNMGGDQCPNIHKFAGIALKCHGPNQPKGVKLDEQRFVNDIDGERHL